MVWKGIPGLDLGATVIGPGLFISHGQATILSAERIGANLLGPPGGDRRVGLPGERRPIIGDDVFIGAGAKVLGGHRRRRGPIGANAVVVCDVPAGATAVGVPARIVIAAPLATSEDRRP